jgi:uncharacterized phiE125 gp8 family phage protein
VIELADLKSQLKHPLPESDTSDDALLEQYEAAAVDHVQRITGRYYGPKITTAELIAVGEGTSILRLSEFVSAVSAVTERLYQGDAGTSILTGASDGWVLRIKPGTTHSATLIRKGGSVWRFGYEYPVTAEIGYDPGEEPPAVRQAVSMLAAHWYVTRTPVAIGTISEEIEHTVRDLLRPLTRIG